MARQHNTELQLLPGSLLAADLLGGCEYVLVSGELDLHSRPGRQRH